MTGLSCGEVTGIHVVRGRLLTLSFHLPLSFASRTIDDAFLGGIVNIFVSFGGVCDPSRFDNQLQ